MRQEWPPCDVCGKAATSSAVDVLEGMDASRAWVVCRPGAKHYGCDDHLAGERARRVETGAVFH